MENYELLYNEYFEKKISFFEFTTRLESFIDHVDPGNMQLFYDYTTDNLFENADPDMLMLTYVWLWMLPNRFNRLEMISGSDNMCLTFLKSIRDTYPKAFMHPCDVIENNLNYSIYKRDNLYIILNHTEADIEIKAPKELQNKQVYCVNCGDDIELEDIIELYPYGFYIIDSNNE